MFTDRHRDRARVTVSDNLYLLGPGRHAPVSPPASTMARPGQAPASAGPSPGRILGATASRGAGESYASTCFRPTMTTAPLTATHQRVPRSVSTSR